MLLLYLRPALLFLFLIRKPKKKEPKMPNSHRFSFIDVIGLPCEAILALSNGHMNCSGLVTNETCSFSCADGYEMLGSKRRTCLNSSKWDGQQTFCKGKCVKYVKRLLLLKIQTCFFISYKLEKVTISLSTDPFWLTQRISLSSK